MTTAILIACHNRRKKTLECIRRLKLAAARAGVDYQIILFDDGSNDGTGEAVLEIEPGATLLKGDGFFFWNRGMHAAFATALRDGYSDYVWLNDDTMLEQDAFEVIKDTLARTSRWRTIVVGAIKDPASGRISYGGGRRTAPLLKPFKYAMVEPRGRIEKVDVFNGNLVWIPDDAARRIGNLDPRFEHAMGDIDYSLRARELGIQSVQTPTFIGSCPRNDDTDSFKDPRLPLFQRIRKILNYKGLPWRSWLHICVRHGGMLWPLHFLWPYVKVLLNRS